MSESAVQIIVNTSDIDRKLKQLAKDNPKFIKGGARAVNREVIKQLKRELASRGYLPHKAESFGDAGYLGKKNIASAVNKDLSVKIWYSKNYYQMKFNEYGAHVRWRHKRGDFILPGRPSLNPKAKEYWETGKAAEIIEKYLQQQYNKLMGN